MASSLHRGLRALHTGVHPSRNIIIEQINQRLAEQYGSEQARVPSTATAYRWLEEISKGRYTFGSGKSRRIAADRPNAPYGRLRATRPGEYFVLDTTRLDVFAMEPVTLRWVPVELTVAQDLYTRCIVGLRLTPVSTNSGDVANVLHQAGPRRSRGTTVRGPSMVFPAALS